MAVEVISCPACGTKNARHRSVCLKCGVSRSATEPHVLTLSSPGISAFPDMNENLGRIVSEFVEKRITDGPQREGPDLWSEAVYAALFSVAFEIVTRSKSAKVSQENLERETKTIIEGTCAHAAPWVDARLAEDIHQSIGVSVKYDDVPLMRYRMLMYFNVAYRAMEERGYEADVARSHACFAILSQVVSELMVRYSAIDESAMKKSGERIPSAAEARSFMKKAFEACEVISGEIAKLLDSYAK